MLEYPGWPPSRTARTRSQIWPVSENNGGSSSDSLRGRGVIRLALRCFVWISRLSIAPHDCLDDLCNSCLKRISRWYSNPSNLDAFRTSARSSQNPYSVSLHDIVPIYRYGACCLYVQGRQGTGTLNPRCPEYKECIK